MLMVLFSSVVFSASDHSYCNYPANKRRMHIYQEKKLLNSVSQRRAYSQRQMSSELHLV